MKLKVVTHFQVDRREVEKQVYEFYDQDFDCVSSEEWSNCSSNTYFIEKKQINEWQQKEIERFKAGKESACILKTLLTDMCNYDVIEPGNYLITASW